MIEALRGLAAELSPAQLDELLGHRPSRPASADASIPRQPHERPSGGDPDRSGQGRLFEHLLLFLRRLGRLVPIVLIIEDIHWADRSTLEWLGFLVHNLREGPIVLLATYRSDELHQRHPLLPLVASLERGGYAERLELARFDRRELTDLLEGILGAKADPDLVDAIHARSGGNAFFAEELLAAEASPGRLPQTLAEVLAERIGMLSEPAQELIRVASGHFPPPRIHVPLVAAVMATDEMALDAGLREAVASQILVSKLATDDHQFSFRHALVRGDLRGPAAGEPEERGCMPRSPSPCPTRPNLTAICPGPPSSPTTGTLHMTCRGPSRHPFGRGLPSAMSGFADAEANYERALELERYQVPEASARAPLWIGSRSSNSRRTTPRHAVVRPRALAYARAAAELVDPVVAPSPGGAGAFVPRPAARCS